MLLANTHHEAVAIQGCDVHVGDKDHLVLELGHELRATVPFLREVQREPQGQTAHVHAVVLEHHERPGPGHDLCVQNRHRRVA